MACPALAGAATVVLGASMEALASLSASASEPVVALASTTDSIPDGGPTLAESEESEGLVRLGVFGD
jgi:hypothetical protein